MAFGMADSGGAAAAGGAIAYFTPIQDAQDPLLDLKKLALNMLKQAIVDIGKPRLKEQTLVWVNYDRPDARDWVTSFESVCWLLGRDVARTRRLLNRFAESNLNLERVRDKVAMLEAENRQKRRGKARQKTRHLKRTGSHAKAPLP